MLPRPSPSAAGCRRSRVCEHEDEIAGVGYIRQIPFRHLDHGDDTLRRGRVRDRSHH
jgi:hypothetical protein